MLDVILIFIASTLLYLVFWWSQRNYKYWEKKKVKHLKPVPLLGNYGPHIYQKKGLGEIVSDICYKLPNEPIVGAYYGTEPVAIVQDPELIKLVLVKDYYYFNAREVAEHTHKEVVTKNLFFSYGDHWKLMRQNLTPVFTSARMRGMFPLIEKCSKVFEKLIDEESAITEVHEVRNLIARFTMDCVCSAFMGLDSKVMETKDTKTNPFSVMAETLLDKSSWRGFRAVARSVWPDMFYKLGLSLFSEDIYKFFRPLLHNVFQNRNWEPTNRQDFIDFLINIKKNNSIQGDSIKSMKEPGHGKITLDVDEELLVTQCIMFFGAGFDTSATIASFAMYELAKKPEVLKKVHDEVDKYIASKNGVLDYDCVTEFPYLEQCLSETMRLYPVLQILTREVFEDYTFPNGLSLEKGIRVHVPVHHLQMNPRYYPNPADFQPERFSSENKHKLVPFTYFPFGEGPRLCMGLRFAKMQMTAGLVTLLKKYTVELAEGMPRKVEFTSTAMITQSTVGINLKLTPRVGKENVNFK